MKFLLLLFLFFPIYIQAQDTVISYSEVVIVDSASKNDLFIKARQWFNETFKSSKDVLQINDKETGELAGKGIMPVMVKYKYLGQKEFMFEANFSISIWIKDNKYKYELKDFNVYYQNPNTLSIGILTSAKECPTKVGLYSQKVSNEMWESAKQGVEYQVKTIIISLENAMRNKKPKSDF